MPVDGAVTVEVGRPGMDLTMKIFNVQGRLMVTPHVPLD